MGSFDVEKILQQMTLEEKAQMCSGRDFWRTQDVERLGIPKVMMCDGPNGLRKQIGGSDALGINESIETVCYPTASAVAASFDTELLRELGEILGEECQAEHVGMLLGPGINMKRSPLCGRNFEYFSEDPYLAGKLGASYIKGLQGKGVAACVKHFACNNQEDNRMHSDSIVSERALREIYLRGFEIAVTKSQPMAIMTSYNLINGVHAANSYDLCTKAARNEWGYRGLIMTDWTTTHNGPDCTASGCMRAGNDIVMPGYEKDHENLRKELADGTLDLRELKLAVGHLVHIIWQSNQYITE